VADWIASDERSFPFGVQGPGQPPDDIDPSSWCAQARERAEQTLTRLGWHPAPDCHEVDLVRRLFAAFDNQDWKAALGLFDPAVEWSAAGQGTHRGPEGVVTSLAERRRVRVRDGGR
jgi:hypothetical protein